MSKANDTRSILLGAINDLSRLKYNHNGSGGLPMRPDAYVLAMATIGGQQIVIDLPPACADAWLSQFGTIRMKIISPTSHRNLLLGFVCGEAIEYHKRDTPSGLSIYGTVVLPDSSEAIGKALDEVNQAIAWVKE